MVKFNLILFIHLLNKNKKLKSNRLIFETLNKSHAKKLISVMNHPEIYKFVDEDIIFANPNNYMSNILTRYLIYFNNYLLF